MSFKHSIARLCGIKMLSILFAMCTLNVIQLWYIAVLFFRMDGNIRASILHLKTSPNVSCTATSLEKWLLVVVWVRYPFYCKTSIVSAQRLLDEFTTYIVRKAWHLLGVSFHTQPRIISLKLHCVLASKTRSGKMIYSKQFVAWRSNAIAREVFIKLLEKVYYFLSSTVAHLKN